MDLAFIIQTGPPNKDRQVQRRIRKHVMKDIGRARRKGDKRSERKRQLHFSLEIPDSPNPFDQTPRVDEVDVTLTSDPSVNLRPVHILDSFVQGFHAPVTGKEVRGQLNAPANPQSQNLQSRNVDPMVMQGVYRGFRQEEDVYAIPPIERVWTGRMDPFVKYPIEMTHRTLQLADHVFDDRYGNTPPFRDAWFPVGMMDPAAFHQVLSNAALNIACLRTASKAPETYESMLHHAKAVTMVKERIVEPSEAITDGLIGAVTGFACYKHGIGDIAGWHTHMNGIKEMIRLRGGIDNLNSSRLVRIVLFWVDIGGSSSADIEPYFPLPFKFLPQKSPWPSHTPLPQKAQQLSATWQQKYPERSEIMKIMSDLNRFSLYVASAAKQNHGAIYSKGEFAALHLCPIVHQLLSLSTVAVDTEDEGSVIQEALRLSCILYIAEIRRLFGIMAIISGTQVRKLRSLLKSSTHSWKELEPLKPWCLAMGAMEASGEERKWFVASLLETMRDHSFRELEELERVLESVMWFHESHSPLLMRLK